jgi:hypothetical protein
MWEQAEDCVWSGLALLEIHGINAVGVEFIKSMNRVVILAFAPSRGRGEPIGDDGNKRLSGGRGFSVGRICLRR